jgi:curved DNA-binding protein CbpA
MFVAQPVTSNLINKNPGKRGIIYAILALCLMASFTTYTGYLSEKDESLYSLLEIPVTTPQTQIKRAYRKVSLKYHPDKQVDLDDTAKEKATERFAKIQEASEVLQDSRAREIYDKFGPRAVRNYQKNISDDPSMSALISLGINFAIWGLLTFMLTLSDSGSQSRTYSFSGLVAITLVAWQLQLDDFDFLVDYLWFWTKYDKAQILIQLYPPFMRGASIIANAQFVDKEKIRNEQIQWIMNALQVLHEKVEKLDGRKLPNKNKSQVEDETLSTTIASSGGTVDLLKRSQLKKMAAKKKGGVSGASKILKDPAKTTSSEFGIPSWAWGIGVYFFINWVLS